MLTNASGPRRLGESKTSVPSSSRTESLRPRKTGEQASGRNSPSLHISIGTTCGSSLHISIGTTCGSGSHAGNTPGPKKDEEAGGEEEFEDPPLLAAHAELLSHCSGTPSTGKAASLS